MRAQCTSRAAAMVFTAVVMAFVAGPASAQGVVGEWDSIKPPPAPKLQQVTVDPAMTALLVMDFNAKNCTPDKRARCAAAIPKVKMLLDQARAHHMLVVYTRGPGMTDSDFVATLAPQAGERIFVGRADKFAGNGLDQYLKDHGITTLITTGTVANGAVLYTTFAAASRGYKVIVPVDTVPATHAYAEQMTIWQTANGPIVHNASTLTSAAMVKF